MEMLIETKGLEFQYPDGTKALKGVDLALEKGTKTAFVGPNGSGKSTLFLHFNGILRPAKGKIFFEGYPLRYDKGSLRKLRQKIGIVLQDADDQLFAPSVWQDVAFGPKNLGLPDEEIRERVERALKIVGIEELAEKPPHFLSGGQKKRVAIAGLLAMDPEVLILDEPTSDLDPEGSEEVIEVLEELSRSGRTVVVSTHNVELAYSWAEYVYVMASGTVKAQGRPEEIFSDTSLLKETKLTCPKLVEFYNEFREMHGVMERQMPKNLLEFLSQTSVSFLKFAGVEEGVKENDYVRLFYDNGRLRTGKPHYGPDGEGIGRIMKLWNNHLAAVEIVEERGRGAGKIFIYIADGFQRSDFFRCMDACRPDFVGAMGTRAKWVAHKEGIRLHFERDVIHKALLKAVSGKATLLLTTRGMGEYAKRRIEEYVLESGLKIRVEVFDKAGRKHC
jgi:cobalt/nickel transport system ATP-binding protein